MLSYPVETVETETRLNSVLDMLIDISSRLQAIKHFVDEVRADKAVARVATEARAYRALGKQLKPVL